MSRDEVLASLVALCREVFGPATEVELPRETDGLVPLEPDVDILTTTGRLFARRSDRRVRQRKPGSCFYNAASMVIDLERDRKYGNIRYAQGIVHIAPKQIAFPHAWCVTESDEVIDASVPRSTFALHDYFGVVFPTTAVGRWISRNRVAGWIPLALATED